MNNNMDGADVRDNRDLGAFIPSWLDDYPLDPEEFRIYARICRRASGDSCFEGLASMADKLFISLNQVRKIFKFLEISRMITVERNPGRTHTIKLTSCSKWVDKDALNGIRLQVGLKVLDVGRDTYRKINKPDRKESLDHSNTPTKTGRGKPKGKASKEFQDNPYPAGWDTPTQIDRTLPPEQVGKGNPIRYSPERDTDHGPFQGDGVLPLPLKGQNPEGDEEKKEKKPPAKGKSKTRLRELTRMVKIPGNVEWLIHHSDPWNVHEAVLVLDAAMQNGHIKNPIGKFYSTLSDLEEYNKESHTPSDRLALTGQETGTGGTIDTVLKEMDGIDLSQMPKKYKNSGDKEEQPPARLKPFREVLDRLFIGMPFYFSKGGDSMALARLVNVEKSEQGKLVLWFTRSDMRGKHQEITPLDRPSNNVLHWRIDPDFLPASFFNNEPIDFKHNCL